VIKPNKQKTEEKKIITWGRVLLFCLGFSFSFFFFFFFEFEMRKRKRNTKEEI